MWKVIFNNHEIKYVADRLLGCPILPIFYWEPCGHNPVHQIIGQRWWDVMLHKIEPIFLSLSLALRGKGSAGKTHMARCCGQPLRRPEELNLANRNTGLAPSQSDLSSHLGCSLRRP